VTIRSAPWAPVATDRRSSVVLSRFAVPTRHPAFWPALWSLVVATELVVLAPVVLGDEPTPGYRVVFRLIGGSFAACGLIAWHRRPDSRSGPLMVATGFGLFVEPLFGQFHSPELRTVGDIFEDVWGIAIIALLLTFLTAGRLTTRLDRLLVGAFVAQLGIEIARHLFLTRTATSSSCTRMQPLRVQSRRPTSG
jgi:hypothetical protein